MKKVLMLFLSGCFVFFLSCLSQTEKLGDFKLLPIPQQFEVKGVSKLNSDDILHYYTDENIILGAVNLLNNIQPIREQSKAQIVYTIDKSLDTQSEGYTLHISSDQIIITGKDKAGLFYAFMTLEQLIEDANEQNVSLPICSIKDYPLLSYRAIHLDVKHHLEKTDYYYRLIDKLGRYKVNAIIAEVEDKIKYERQPLVGSEDALSITEWKNLSIYAKERNIEISPLIQGLGHASFILKHEEYKNLRDDPKSDWAFNPLDPKVYDVQFDLYLDAIEATPYGKYIHVGGDEVHTTGRNSAKTPLELQLIWLNKVCKFAEEHGRTPIFWDDMPLKHAEVYKPMFNIELSGKEVDSIWVNNEHNLLKFLDQFPKNCVYMRWNYSSSQAIGNGKAMEWFRNNGLQVMGATAGQTRWVLMPQNESNMDNIKSFALTSINKGLNRLLLTLWDDDSPHFELYMRGIIAFAEYTWSGEKRTKNDLKSAYRHREFSNTLADPKFAFIDQLEEPVSFWKNVLLKGNKRNRLLKLNDPINEAVIDFPDKNKKGKWSKQYSKRLEKAEIFLQNCNSIALKISTMKSNAIRNTYRLQVYEQVNNLVQFSLKALLALRTYDLTEDKQQETNSIVNIKKLPEEFKKLRKQFELVYSKTRILTKPKNYILDQDHHAHLANQTISFDWQFFAEMLFLEKIEDKFK